MATALKTVSATPCGQQSRMYERHYAPAELAEMCNLSADTVRRMFEGEAGVLVFENPVRSSSRRFRTLLPTRRKRCKRMAYGALDTVPS